MVITVPTWWARSAFAVAVVADGPPDREEEVVESGFRGVWTSSSLCPSRGLCRHRSPSAAHAGPPLMVPPARSADLGLSAFSQWRCAPRAIQTRLPAISPGRSTASVSAPRRRCAGAGRRGEIRRRVGADCVWASGARPSSAPMARSPAQEARREGPLRGWPDRAPGNDAGAEAAAGGTPPFKQLRVTVCALLDDDRRAGSAAISPWGAPRYKRSRYARMPAAERPDTRR